MPLPTPTTKAGPSWNVHSWRATNASPTVTLHDLHLYALDDGHEIRADQFEVDVGELHAVEALDKPETARHMHTRTTRIEVDSRPYRIVGYVHGPVGADPAHTLLRRPKMIPLTEPILEYESGGELVRVEPRVLIFNRTRARGVRPVDLHLDKEDDEADGSLHYDP